MHCSAAFCSNAQRCKRSAETTGWLHWKGPQGPYGPKPLLEHDHLQQVTQDQWGNQDGETVPSIKCGLQISSNLSAVRAFQLCAQSQSCFCQFGSHGSHVLASSNKPLCPQSPAHPETTLTHRMGLFPQPGDSSNAMGWMDGSPQAPSTMDPVLLLPESWGATPGVLKEPGLTSTLLSPWVFTSTTTCKPQVSV